MKINYDELDKQISLLNGILNTQDNSKIVDTVGGGKSVTKLEEIEELYQSITKSMKSLISNTVILLKQTKKGFQTVDTRTGQDFRKQ